MELVWNEYKKTKPVDGMVENNTEYMVCLAEINDDTDQVVKSAVEACIEKSVGLLSANIREESLYMLFEWDVLSSDLTIVVTDDNKKYDSPYMVKCCFSALEQQMKTTRGISEEKWEVQVNCYATKVKDWIRDYLTTCSGFMRYSLVAAFHSEGRSSCVLL